MNWRSIRFRLTLWYLTALTIGIALFGFLVWTEMRQQLLKNREEALDHRLSALGQFLEYEARSNDLSAIQEEAREYSTGLPPGHGLRLLDLTGRLVYEQTPGPGNLLTRSREISARGMRFHAELSIPLDDYFRTLAILQWVLIVPFPAVLLLAGAMGWWLAGRGLRPVGEMTRQAKEIQAKDLSARISVPRTGDELQRLAESWNELLERIEASVQHVKRFTADAAHELRTPLAVMRTTAELSLRQERTAERYRKAMELIHSETASMTDLVEQLLLLAREDSGQWQFRFDSVRLGDILRDIHVRVRAVAEQRGISIHTHLPSQEALVWADADAIRRLVLILVDNAIKHGAMEGNVEVSLACDSMAAILTVADDGPGIGAEHLPHVFERFYRADPARTSGSGAGLGLAIARSIAEAHHAHIDLQSRPGQGTVVRVTIPLLGQPEQPVSVGLARQF